MSRHWWILAAALTGAVLIPLLLGGSGLFGRLRSFPLDLLALMLGMIVLGWYLNAQRLRLLVGRRTLAQRRAIGIVMATEFAICATPGGAGGPLTLMALLMRHGVPPSKGTATYAVEQLSDLLFFICALVGVLIFALTHAMNAYIASLLGITTALLIGNAVNASNESIYPCTILVVHLRVFSGLGQSISFVDQQQHSTASLPA